MNSRCLLSNAIWQMDVTHYPPVESLHYVHIIVDTCSSYVYALAHVREKASHVNKALKSAMLVMRLLWPLKTVNSPDYSSRQHDNFLTIWKIDCAFGNPYNPQRQDKALWRGPPDI